MSIYGIAMHPRLLPLLVALFLVGAAVSGPVKAADATTPEATFDGFMRDDARGGLQGQKGLINVTSLRIPTRVSAAKLAAAFQDNGLAADRDYGQKWIIIDGLFEGARRGALDNPYVLLGDGSEYGHGAQLFLDTDAIDQASKLRPRNKTALVCDNAEGGIEGAIAKDCIFFDRYVSRSVDEVMSSIDKWLTDGTPSPYLNERVRDIAFFLHYVIIKDALTCDVEKKLDQCLRIFAVLPAERKRLDGPDFKAVFAERADRLQLGSFDTFKQNLTPRPKSKSGPAPK